MGGKKRSDSDKKSGRVLDFFVVFFCLSGAVVSLYLFQDELFRTVRSMSIQPVGTVAEKYNTVQRRLADRVVWDRLFAESPVYHGDLIRIAKHSGAILNIDGNSIELGENTLIHIQKDASPLLIVFFHGDINVTSDTGGGITLAIGDRIVEAVPGAVFSASVGGEGIVLRVNEGSAQLVQDGKIQNASAGMIITRDNQGRERLQPMVALTSPRPNARFLKTVSRPLPVNFVWNRINFEGADSLLLEIAEDRAFAKIVQSFENPWSFAVVPMDAGCWYWRISFEKTILGSGRVMITDAVPPSLINPVMDRQFYFGTSSAQINFQWTAVDEAQYYLLRAGSSPDLLNPQIDVQVQGTSFTSAQFKSGTWYWQVQPVYSSSYEGGSVSSQTAVFHIF